MTEHGGHGDAGERQLAHGGTRSEIVHGSDDRFPITNATLMPYASVVRVNVTFPDGSGGFGSGIVVGRNDVLTAGHVVYDRYSGGYATRIEIVAAQSGSNHPFGETMGVRARIPTQYATTESPDYDIAVVQTRTDIGNQTGWLGLRSVPEFSDVSQTVIHTAGYPYDRQLGNYMYGATDRADFLSGNRLFYNGRLDTYSGQSGSGIWVEEGGQRHIVGVHTSGGYYFNAGTALTPEIHRQVVSWINDDVDPTGVTATVPGGATMAITGTDGVDNIVGTVGNDLIRLLGGDDACRAGDGGDLVYGNAGRDILEGDGGNDTLFGGRDGDTLSGNAGADRIYGNLADDALYGGTGADTLYGGQGQDRLLGGDGADVLYGGAGDDLLYGDNTESSTGAGIDTLYGGVGTDTAVYLFARATYIIQRQADGSLLINSADRLYDVEILRFSDGDVQGYLFA